jgi:hypothetical protein
MVIDYLGFFFSKCFFFAFVGEASPTLSKFQNIVLPNLLFPSSQQESDGARIKERGSHPSDSSQ